MAHFQYETRFHKPDKRLFADTAGKQFFVDEIGIGLIVIDFASAVVGI